jgi:hypothetical protein
MASQEAQPPSLRSPIVADASVPAPEPVAAVVSDPIAGAQVTADMRIIRSPAKPATARTGPIVICTRWRRLIINVGACRIDR